MRSGERVRDCADAAPVETPEVCGSESASAGEIAIIGLASTVVMLSIPSTVSIR
jgi:hypothetical protein